MATYAKHCPKLPWMIDFHSGKDNIPNCQLKAAFAKNRIHYLADLNVESQVPRQKLTGIICATGPSCEDFDILEDMMDAGMTMVQLNLCHCCNEECSHPVKRIRCAAECYSMKIGRVYPLGIAVDLRGSHIETGTLKNHNETGIKLAKDTEIILTIDPEYEAFVTHETIYVNYEKIIEIVTPGSEVCIGSEGVRLVVIEVGEETIKCLVKNPGIVRSHSSVVVPGAPIHLPPLSCKDLDDIKYGMLYNVEAFFVSGIRSIATIEKVKEMLKEQEECKRVLVVAKIDNAQALKEIDAIISKSDGVIIDRDGLSMELAVEKVFLVEKSLIARCNKAGKPAIITAHVLDSMMSDPFPKNSEVSDIANAVLDGADCFVLTTETSLGDDPVKSVKILSSICKEAEAAVYQKQVFSDLSLDLLMPIEPIYALALSAVEASLKCNAAVIVVLTVSGRSARAIAKYRPRCPVIAVTRCLCVAKKLHLYRAVVPIYYTKEPRYCWQKDVEDRVQLGITWGKVRGFIRASDAIIAVTGSRPGAGFTNSMQIQFASEFDVLPQE